MTTHSNPRRLRRAALALAAAAGLAIPVAAAIDGSARAAFPGTNGKIICSGPLNAIPDPVPQGQSRLELFTMDGDGSNETRLLTNDVADYSPRYSADGTKVAFNRNDTELWTMNADGTNQVRLLEAALGLFVGDWSPDGTQIVFSMRVPATDTTPTNFEVMKINADGTGLVNISNNHTTGANSDSQPSWSPDGSRIAFQSDRDGNINVHLMDPDGSNVVNLTAASPAEESAPRWSSDGEMLAFQTNRDNFPVTGPRNYEIYRMNADGSNVKRLTYSPSSAQPGEEGFDLTGYDVFPAWSPEGDRIVFHSGRAPEYRDSGAPGILGQWEVYTVDAVNGEDPDTHGGVVRLTNRPHNDERCDWQPIPYQSLTVALAGDGSGTVVSAPAGIDCGADCSDEFEKDSEVTLAAAPAEGSSFAGFSGGGCSGTSPSCTLTMSEAKTVTATFSKAPPVVVTPTPTATPEPTLTRQVAGLSVRVTPKRDRTRPFRFRVRGRLTHPSSVQVADACQGRVTVRWKAGKKTISSRRTQLIGLSCRYSQRVKFRAPRRFGKRSVLRVQVKFEGNKFLLPRRAKTVRARVR